MDISSARLADLLKEVVTPQAVPLAKADPVKTALVKAILAPPAPSGSLARPVATPTLPMLLPATAGRAQQTASAQMIQAYLALTETDSETAGDAASVATGARRPEDGDTAQRGLALPLARVDEKAAARPASLPWLPLLSVVVSPPRRASIASAAAAPGPTGSRQGDPARLEHRQVSVGLMSLAAGLLAAAVVGFALLVLR